MTSILFLLNSDFGIRGTVGNRSVHPAQAIDSKKFKLKIICRDYNSIYKNKYDLEKALFLGNLPMKVLTAIPIYFYNNFPANKIKIWLYQKAVIKKLKKFDLKKFDLVHSWDFAPEIFNFLKKKNPKIKIIVDLQMAFPNLLNEIAKKEKYWDNISLELEPHVIKAIPYIDGFIVPSDSTKQSLINHGVAAKKIGLIPYGVDLKGFKPLNNKVYDGEFRACYVGNINNRKGVRYSIDAWKKSGLKNAKLTFYGHLYTEARAHFKNCEQFNIYTPGYVDVKKELPKNHIYVHPSLLETTPKTIMEALASGLPVITTPNSGPNFKDGVQGFIVPHQNPKEIADKLKLLYNDRTLLKKMSQNARKFAEKYTWKSYGINVIKFYDKILKQ